MKQTKLYSILFAVMFISTATWAGKARLISIDVMQKIGDSIKTTGEYSEEIEVELADVVETLDSNMKFYEDTGCSSNESVDGCRQAKAKIKENYAKMLNVIKTKLPEMRTALQVASNSVVGELKRNVATKDVPSLQEYLLSQTSGESPVVESKRRYNSKRLNGVRLSSRFEDYYRLISASRSQNTEPLVVTAASVLLDMKDSMKYIDFTLDTIEEQTVGMSFEASLGDVTPQMKNVVGGVQAVLFGKPLEVSQVTPHNIEFEEVSPVNESWESQLGL